MLRVLIGLLWICFGLIFLHRPQLLHHWLRWRSLRKIRWTLFWAALGAGVSLIMAAWPLHGTLATLMVLAGIIGVVKAYFFLKCESSEWLVERLAELPEEAYRWLALVYIGIGLMLIFVLG